MADEEVVVGELSAQDVSDILEHLVAICELLLTAIGEAEEEEKAAVLSLVKKVKTSSPKESPPE